MLKQIILILFLFTGILYSEDDSFSKTNSTEIFWFFHAIIKENINTYNKIKNELKKTFGQSLLFTSMSIEKNFTSKNNKYADISYSERNINSKKGTFEKIKYILKDIFEQYFIGKNNNTVLMNKFHPNKKIDFIEVSAINKRGYSYYFEGEYDKALEDFNKSIDLNSLGTDNGINGWVYFVRAIVFMEKGDFDFSLKDLKEAIRIEPNNIYPYVLFGIIYNYIGRYNEAIKMLNHALKIDNNFSNAKANLGGTYFMTKQFDLALNYLNDAKKNANVFQEINYIYSTELLIYIEKNDQVKIQELAKQEESFIKEHLQKNVNDASAYSCLAELYCEMNIKSEEAIQLAKKGEGLRPNYFTYYVLGYAYFRTGDYNNAISMVKESLRLNSSMVWHYYRLGCFYKAKGDNKNAEIAFKNGLKINPKHRFILEEIKKL